MFVLMYLNISMEKIQFLSIDINATNPEIYAGLWIGYIYYAWRYSQEISNQFNIYKTEAFKFYLRRNESQFTNQVKEEIKNQILKEYDMEDSSFEDGSINVSFDNLKPADNSNGSIFRYRIGPISVKHGKGSSSSTSKDFVIDISRYLNFTLFKVYFSPRFVFKKSSFLYSALPFFFSIVFIIWAFLRYSWYGNPIRIVLSFFC